MKLFRYFALNAVFALALYFGLVENVDPAKWLSITLVWFCIVAGLFSFKLDEAMKLDIGKRHIEGHLPVKFDMFFDCAVVAFLLSQDYWVSGFLYMISTFQMYNIKLESIALYLQKEKEKSDKNFDFSKS